MEQERGEGANWDGLAPEVLEKIFCHLPVKDLLSCSVMSKNWKKAARDVLKRSRECFAHIKDFHQDIQDLNDMIASTDLMEMVNGLHIRNRIKPKNESGSASSSSSQQSFLSSDVKNAPQTEEAGKILKEAKQRVHEVLCVRWRYLNLDMGHFWKPASSTDDASLLSELISATSGSLEKLVVGGKENLQLIPCNGIEYSKLRVIQLLYEQHDFQNYHKIFSLKFAPKLQEITGGMMVLDVNFPMPRFAMERFKSISLRYIMDNPYGMAVEESQKAFESVSGLRRLELGHSHSGPYEEEHQQKLMAWTAFILTLVRRSLDTLEELYIDTFDLYNLVNMCDELEFPNLRRLRLATKARGGVIIENEISVLRQSNLPKRFLNLEQVELTQYSSYHGLETGAMRPLEEYSGLEQSSLPMKIDLYTDGEIIATQVHEYLTFFNTVYPNAVQVRILKLEDIFAFTIGSFIWKMNSLEYLEINILRYSFSRDEFPFGLDALLCGISIEEAKLLFEESQKMNSKLNSVVVPIRPSLFNATKLKELKITQDWSSCEADVVQYSCVIPVTDNLPVRHERELKVTFEGCELWFNKLKQLRAFSMFHRAQVQENYKVLDRNQFYFKK